MLHILRNVKHGPRLAGLMVNETSENARPRILIVIPAYRESRRLPILFEDIATHLKPNSSYDINFLLVDDGSGADEAARARALIRAYALDERIAFAQLERNQGKGGALKTGFTQGIKSGYDYIGFMDADGAVPVSSLYKALDYMLKQAPAPLAAVIASRVNMLGRCISRSPLRHYVSRVFATFVSIYFNVLIYDSQCGMKIFRKDVVEKYLNAPIHLRWVWDTELILAMIHGGETVHEVPVDWREMAGSTMSLCDPIIMTAHLVSFRRSLLRR